MDGAVSQVTGWRATIHGRTFNAYRPVATTPEVDAIPGRRPARSASTAAAKLAREAPASASDPPSITAKPRSAPTGDTVCVEAGSLIGSLRRSAARLSPPFASGSPDKADASTLRLALRVLLGDRPMQMMRRLNNQAGAARLRRARRALAEHRAGKRQTPPARGAGGTAIVV